MSNGFGQDLNGENKRPKLDIESLSVFLLLLHEQKYSGRNTSDMDALKLRLEAEGESEEMIKSVIWRFRNVCGLC